MKRIYYTSLCLFMALSMTIAQVQITTIVPELNASGGLSRDAAGNIYISDFGPGNSVDSNTTVYKLDISDFSISTFCDGFIGASGSCFDSQGNFYQANNNGNRISKIHPDGTKEMDWATGLSLPIGVIADDQDNIFTCNCSANTISKITADGTVTTFAEDDAFNCPNGLTIDPDNNLYVCNFSDGKVFKISPTGTVSLVANLPTLSGGPSLVGNGHLTYSNGYLYVNLIGLGQIYRVCTSGENEAILGQAFGFDNVDGIGLSAKLSKPNGIIASTTGDTLFINCSEPTWPTNPSALHPAMVRMVTGINSLEDDLCDLPNDLPLFSELTTGAIVNNLTLSMGNSWADYDEDGDMDVFVTIGNGNNRLYRNNGDLTFSLVSGVVSSDGGASGAAIWGDYNNDGYIDLYVSNNPTPPLAAAANFLYKNDGPPNYTFSKITNEAPAIVTNYTWSSSWVDYDNDGDLDLHVPENRHLNTDYFFENNGTPNAEGQYFSEASPGFITDAVESTGVASWMDYDNDCDQDIFLIKSGRTHPNGGEDNRFFHNELQETGSLNFTRVLGGAMLSHFDKDFQASWGDYDNDGDMDVYLGNFDAPNYLYRNEGDSIFTQITSGSPVEDNTATLGSTWGDFDNDGDLDLFVSNTLGQNSAYYENNGDGTFQKQNAAAVGPPLINLSGTQSSACADINNDGYLDLFLANGAISPTQISRDFLYVNNGGNNNFLLLTLEGSTSNASAIGAKVRIKSEIDGNPTWQMRVRSGSPTGDRAQNSERIHFGIGSGEIIDTLIIEWPNCQSSVFANVIANQICTINEDGSTDCDLDIVQSNTILSPDIHQLKILQNPVQNGQLIIQYKLDDADLVNFQIHDLTGRLIKQYGVQHNISGDLTLDLGGLQKGFYLLTMNTSSGKTSRKFIIP